MQLFYSSAASNGLSTTTMRSGHPHAIHNAITTMSSILLQRNSNDSIQQSNSTNNTLCDLPSQLVGEIASYLTQRAYGRLSQINRKIFIDCHSPNRLNELDLTHASSLITVALCENPKFRTVVLSNYPKIKALKLRSGQVCEWSAGSISAYCRRLETLYLQLDTATRDLSQFIKQNECGFPGVLNMALTKISGITIPWNLFVQFLSLFPNLKSLRLKNVRFSTPIGPEQLRNPSLNIGQLYLRGIRDEATFLELLGSKLTTLTWSPRTAINVTAEWPLLQRLALFAPPRNVMEQFLEKAKRLRLICFIPNFRAERKQPMTDTEIETVTKMLFTDYPSLEFIYLSTRGHFDRICNAIHQGLFRTRNVERKILEIVLHLDCSEIQDLTDFMCNISKILMVLTGSKIKQWTLTLERHKKYNLKPIAQAIRQVISSYPGMDMHLLQRSSSKLVTGKSMYTATHRHWWNDCMKAEFY